MPTLEMINERFARLLRVSFYSLLRRLGGGVRGFRADPEVRRVRTDTAPADQPEHREVPSRCAATGLVILDPKLVFTLVDMYFGGRGRHAKIEGREFTAVENEIIRALLASAFANLREAWSHVAELRIEHVGSEMNPHFANIVSPTEIVVVCSFACEIEGRGGELHVTMPYSMIEPLREQLDSGVQSDRVEQDDRWAHSLRQRARGRRSGSARSPRPIHVSVKRLLELKPGDVVTGDFSGQLTLLAEDVPMFRGSTAIRADGMR